MYKQYNLNGSNTWIFRVLTTSMQNPKVQTDPEKNRWRSKQNSKTKYILTNFVVFLTKIRLLRSFSCFYCDGIRISNGKHMLLALWLVFKLIFLYTHLSEKIISCIRHNVFFKKKIISFDIFACVEDALNHLTVQT